MSLDQCEMSECLKIRRWRIWPCKNRGLVVLRIGICVWLDCVKRSSIMDAQMEGEQGRLVNYAKIR